MDMSASALPPRSGSYRPRDMAHPLFPLYRAKLNACARLMIDAPDFGDFCHQTEQERYRDDWARHERYPEFMTWMRAEQGGARSCLPSRDMPYGLSFPENFKAWLDGVRW